MPSDSYTLTISSLGIPATHASTHTSGGTDAISINASQVTAGTLPVTRGGTGAATLTGYVKGTGTTAMTASATVPVADISGTLPVANGGTGAATLTGYVKANGTTVMTASASVPVGDISGTLSVANGGTGVTSSTGSGNNVLSTSPTLVTPILGTPTSGTLTSCTGLPLSTGVTGTLLVANGGTGVTSSTGTGSTVLSTSPTLVTPILGTPTSGTLTSCTGLPLTTGVTGTLPVANGGTGVTSSTGSGNNVLSTSPVLVTPALGTPSSGTLTSCTGLPLTSGVTGTLLVANGGTGVTSSTGSGNNVLSTSPTLVTPTLTTPVLGVATATSLAATGAITSSGTAGIGYATNAGGTVTQLTSKATPVTLNKICGQITMDAASLAHDTVVSFVLNNTTIAAGDVLILNHLSVGSVGRYMLNAQCAANSATINVKNANPNSGALAEAIVIAFVVIKAVSA